MWGPWMQIHSTKDQIEKWEKIPHHIFWIKIAVILAMTGLIGVLLMVINI
tara:strand:+ start:11197 stop:11346 length:150 start_codon:yes stop_codon:yes gene_type:complete